MTPPPRAYRAGESLEDFWRACKTDRRHTIIAVDAGGQPLRVACGYCRSDHNFRGGPRVEPSRAAPAREPFPLVSARERTAPPMTDHPADLLADDAAQEQFQIGRVVGHGRCRPFTS